MPKSWFSSSWYRVAGLRPRLRRHARIYRQHYRGELWYVLQDRLGGRFYRFNPTAYQVIGMMNGTLTVEEIWSRAVEKFGDDAPTQEEMVQLLSRLYAADVLLCDVPPDTAELFRRRSRLEKAKWYNSLRTPLAFRLPLVNPEKFLQRTLPYAQPLFSRTGLILWLAVTIAALGLAWWHWQELTADLVDRVLTAHNILLLWLLFPLLKACHELGHAYALKALGGEVPEMGVMFLVFTPLPYVDASAAQAFREKWRRVLVGSAGMMTELFLASLALFAWLQLTPGFWRSLCFNVMLIAGVSTVLFNANPLLRFDGYYILADFLDILNLAQRSTEYWDYLFKRYLLGLKDLELPYATPGERAWFVVYSLASWIYRLLLYLGLIIFIAGRYFFLGVLLAIWASLGLLLFPAARKIHALFTTPALLAKRGRLILVVGGLGLAVLLILFVLPFPSWTRSEGVVWAPEDALVRAGTEGFVAAIMTPPGHQVSKGQVLLTLEDPLLAAQIRVLEAQLREVQARYYAEVAALGAVEAGVVKEELIRLETALSRERERQAALILTSPASGTLILPQAQDLPGRFVRQGDLLGYLLTTDRPTIRVVVPQTEIDLLRQRLKRVQIRLAARMDTVIPAVIKRIVPGAEDKLPSTILGTVGGGDIPVDLRDQSGLKTFENLFQVDLEPLEPVGQVCLGGRVYVRFDHGAEPLGYQWYRSLRQLFLRRLNV